MQHLTQHLTEEHLISHYYHDADAPFATEHLAACGECRAQFDTLCSVLTLVDQLPIPERGDVYGDEVWTRLRWKLGSNRRHSVYGWMSIAAALAVAFIGGIFWHARTQQSVKPQTIVAHNAPTPAAQPAAIASASENRLLLVVVSDHLDSSERMLLEITNADAKHPLDVASESKRAGELVASNRIYRQTAARRGETRIASLLSDLSRFSSSCRMPARLSRPTKSPHCRSGSIRKASSSRCAWSAHKWAATKPPPQSRRKEWTHYENEIDLHARRRAARARAGRARQLEQPLGHRDHDHRR
jgi:hypothetical protein